MALQRKAGIIAVGAAALVVIAAGLVLRLNVKTVRISTDLSCRVAFGRMSAGEAKKVLGVADGELMPARKYVFARDAYRAVATYHGGALRGAAYLGVAQTYLAEGQPAAAYPWLVRITKEHPRGAVVESRRLDGVVTKELERLLARPPLDYPTAVRYLGLLGAAGSPDAAAWRTRFRTLLETPFTVSASYTHEKELAYVVKETATKDARTTALFYAREQIPAALLKRVKERADFGAAVPDDKLAAFVESRVRYVGALSKVQKKELDEQAKVRLDKEREEKGVGALPAEWAAAFAAADEDTGWTASAAVVGELKDITLAEILTSAGVDPLTGGPARR
jgi:hypothetical protein